MKLARRDSMRPAAVLLLLATVALAQQPQTGIQGAKPVLENDRVLVVEATIAPGEVRAMHKHALPAVIVTLEGARMKDTLPNGTTRTYERKAGDVVWREKDFEHDETNVGPTRLRVIAIQLKR